MIAWLLGNIPWWVWIMIAAVPVVIFWPAIQALWLTLPPGARRAVIAVASLGLVFVAGRHKGWQDAKAEQEKRDAQAKAKRAEIDANVAGRSDKQLDSDLGKWMRK